MPPSAVSAAHRRAGRGHHRMRATTRDRSAPAYDHLRRTLLVSRFFATPGGVFWDWPASRGQLHSRTMDANRTTAAIQGYLDELAGLRGESPIEPVVRTLLGVAAGRLHQLCATLLYRSYPRLTRGPINLVSDEMLSAVVERLIKALRKVRPGN